MLLGVRESESGTRKTTLQENSTADPYWRTQNKQSNRVLFTPIVDFSLHDVWATNLLIEDPKSLLASRVADLYADAGGECPTVRDVHGAPCGKARFGCWTCTVAKGAKTLHNLVGNGNTDLAPLLKFRLWLGAHRDNPNYRWRRRRNGTAGPGPMTLKWRRLALAKLLKAQAESGLPLIALDEIETIEKLWGTE